MTKDKSILIRNIYYMLSYAFTTLNQGGYENVETEEFEKMPVWPYYGSVQSFGNVMVVKLS